MNDGRVSLGSPSGGRSIHGGAPIAVGLVSSDAEVQVDLGKSEGLGLGQEAGRAPRMGAASGGGAEAVRNDEKVSPGSPSERRSIPAGGRSIRGGAPIAVRIASPVPIMILIAVRRGGPG